MWFQIFYGKRKGIESGKTSPLTNLNYRRGKLARITRKPQTSGSAQTMGSTGPLCHCGLTRDPGPSHLPARGNKRTVEGHVPYCSEGHWCWLHGAVGLQPHWEASDFLAPDGRHCVTHFLSSFSSGLAGALASNPMWWEHVRWIGVLHDGRRPGFTGTLHCLL